VLAEGGVGAADAVDGVLDPFRDGEPGPLAGGRGRPIAAAEADGGGELLRQRLDLVACDGCATRVVEALGLVELPGQDVEARAIRGLGGGVERGADVGGRPRIESTEELGRTATPG
jgi:hypothetical protein